MTTEEAASYLRICSKQLDQLAKDGQIPAVLLGQRWRFSRRLLDEWLTGQMRNNCQNGVRRPLLRIRQLLARFRKPPMSTDRSGSAVKAHMVTVGRSTVGQYIRHLRHSRGWLQSDLASQAGIAKSTVSRVELKGDSHWATVDKLLTAFGSDAFDRWPEWYSAHSEPATD